MLLIGETVLVHSYDSLRGGVDASLGYRAGVSLRDRAGDRARGRGGGRAAGGGRWGKGWGEGAGG